MNDESIITSRTILVYKKRYHRTYKGYWLWGKNLRELIIILENDISKDIENYCVKSSIRTIVELEKWINKVNDLYRENELKYKFYVYSDINEAVKRVKRNQSEVYLDYNKTFMGDCLKEE